MNIKKIVKEEFYLLENILQEQQLFHYNLDKEHNSRFFNIHLKEFTEYMTCEDDYICYAVFNEGIISFC